MSLASGAGHPGWSRTRPKLVSCEAKPSGLQSLLYHAVKFGMDTRCWANHAKQCFSFVCNMGHYPITALTVENQNGKRLVSSKDLIGGKTENVK